VKKRKGKEEKKVSYLEIRTCVWTQGFCWLIGCIAAFFSCLLLVVLSILKY
jgi:hypothetical protein